MASLIEELKSAQLVSDNMTDDGEPSIYQRAAERISELEEMLSDRLDIIRCGIATNHSGNPREHELYTSVTELLGQ